ncbi:MAG: flagellar biosynthesis protein FlhA [Phycisphaeraceae bacterium JB051]
MAQLASQLNIPGWINKIGRYQQLFVPIAFVCLLGVIVVPLWPVVMDMLVATNIALAALILLTTIYVASPLEFSVFPSLLLATTLFRLVLNIASTRLILAANTTSPEEATAVAGKVIESFASFVTGGSLIVGLILFVILIIVQFVVITKGATRISEVAARFTLDAMPGKQMAIDADLNAGLIDEKSARKRREDIAQEADFYGAMDGAAKFVRGDAIAGIIITIINILGGFAIGVFEKQWGFGTSLEVFTKLTIGDGLVSQLPSFVISIAAGLIVTRSSGKYDLGTELTRQLTGRWMAMAITACFLAMMAFTGLPATPLLVLATLLGVGAWMVRGNEIKAQKQVVKQEQAKAEKQTTEVPVEQVLAVDLLELEVGYGLVRLVDAGQGGTLLDRISGIRRQLAGDMGLVMPPVRIRDNIQLAPTDYHIKIRGNSVASGSAHPNLFMAMDSGLASQPLEGGIKTREPAFGLDAVWIEPGQKDQAEALNYTVVDATSVVATHLTEVVKNHASELLNREETNNLITQLREKAPKLCAEVLGEGDKAGLIKPGELQKVLQNLLRERVPIRDLETIIETLGDWAPRTKDMDVLTEYVRNGLRRTICNQYVQYVPDDTNNIGGDANSTVPKLFCVSLDPALEDQINGFIDRGAEGSTVSIPPAVATRIVTAILQELQQLIQVGHPPVVLASPPVRAAVRSLLEPHLAMSAVLGYNEVSKGVQVQSVGMVQLESVNQQQQAQGVGR